MTADILAIDPGLTAAGWAVVHTKRVGNVWEVAASDTVRPKPKLGLPERLAYLATRFMLMQRAWTPVVIVCEDPTGFTRHPKAAYRSLRNQMKLGAAYGAILAACRAGWPTVPIVLYTPGEWLKVRGKFAPKKQALEQIRRLVTFGSGNVKPTEHELAACGLALHYIAKEGLV
jgi:Holliday junction resolvasome RuvABC endonuclease subunit